MKERNKRIAKKIAKLEKKYKFSNNKNFIKEIEDLTKNLSIKDMIEIDIFIQEKKLLK